MTDLYQKGIAYAIANLQAGELAAWQSGSAADEFTRTVPKRRKEFEEGVDLVATLPQSLQRAIASKDFAAIDGAWARGQIPEALFPHLRDIGVLTVAAADEKGNSLPGIHRTKM